MRRVLSCIRTCPECGIFHMLPDQERCDMCQLNQDIDYIQKWEERFDAEQSSDVELISEKGGSS